MITCGELSSAVDGVDEDRELAVRLRMDAGAHFLDTASHIINNVTEHIGYHQIINKIRLAQNINSRTVLLANNVAYLSCV